MRTILLGLLASTALVAQATQGDYSFSGTVVNSVTGEPVRSARVSLTEMPQIDPATGMPSNGPDLSPKTARTGPGGGYLFAGLREGQYMLNAFKPGFNWEADTPGAEIITLSASVAGRVIRLAPLGTIEGKLSSQNGDPLGGVSVGVFTEGTADGVRRFMGGHTVVTDDRGHFRLWDLYPGKYYLKALGRAGGTSVYLGDGLIRYDSWEGFHPVYFGGARDMDSATPVEIAAGTAGRADFTLAVEPTFKVRGRLDGFTPNKDVTFVLLEGDPNVEDSRVSLDGTTGKFEIDDVFPGQYTLRATQGDLARGETIVAVKGGDVNGVGVLLVPAVTVTGSERLIGPAPQQTLNPARGSAGDAGGFCTVWLNPLAPLAGEHDNLAHLAEEGGFSIGGVFAGQYRLGLSCQNRYVVSAVSGSSDLLSNPVLTVQPGLAPPPIEIGMKAGGGQLHGKLAVPGAHPNPGVLLVPAAAASAGPEASNAVPMSESSGELEFDFSNLAPGDYLVYGFSRVQSVEYRNPAVLNSLTGGTSVRIEDGKTTEITLTSLVK